MFKLPQLFLKSLVFCVPAAMAAPSANISVSPSIIPQPQKINVQVGKAGFRVDQGIRYSGPYSELLGQTGIEVKKGDQSDIRITAKKELPKGTYSINVTPDQIEIILSNEKDEDALRYALTTLAQSVVKDDEGKAAIISMNVEDYPRFGWRGLMVDSCRHMMPVADIKKVIDLMALYKLNIMHWHLTDDQGWRIEIKKYPKLTEIGSQRKSSPVMGNRNAQDGKPYAGYYTQEQIKDVVAYAKQRGVTIVPEIEMPGHACAAIAAYPQLGNKDIPNYKPEVATTWGVLTYIFNPSEDTFQFIADVIDEVAQLFPDSPYIHVGGDEAPKDQWEKSAFAQEVMKKNGLKNEHALQSYFIRRAEQIINKHQKRLIGWDEIQEGGLSPTATMMVWRDWAWAKHAISRGNDVVMTPNSHCYFDYGQNAGIPKKPEYDIIHNPQLSWQKVYGMEPIPQGTPEDKKHHVLGCQGNVWSEYIPNLAKFQYQVFPRALALAEVAWTNPDQKDESSFKNRLEEHKKLLDQYQVNYCNEDGTPARPQEPIVK